MNLKKTVIKTFLSYDFQYLPYTFELQSLYFQSLFSVIEINLLEKRSGKFVFEHFKSLLSVFWVYFVLCDGSWVFETVPKSIVEGVFHLLLNYTVVL